MDTPLTGYEPRWDGFFDLDLGSIVYVEKILRLVSNMRTQVVPSRFSMHPQPDTTAEGGCETSVVERLHGRDIISPLFPLWRRYGLL